jgi:zinc transport system substrate-binding protein
VLGHFAKQVGGERVEVLQVMPPGAEPHEYEPTPKDIIAVLESDLFIFQDETMEPWAGRIKADALKQGLAVIEISRELDPYIGEGAQGMRFAHGKMIKKDGLRSDPHAWLDPRNAAIETEIIRDALISADPSGREHYENNAALYIKKLGTLDRDFREGLKSCRIRDIVVPHDAYSYLARRYGFTAHAASGLSPQDEPSTGRIASLAAMMKQRGIRHVFFETLVSPRIARTLAAETGAELLVLNPMGGVSSEDIESGKTYISVMRENLANLRVSMGCR